LFLAFDSSRPLPPLLWNKGARRRTAVALPHRAKLFPVFRLPLIDTHPFFTSRRCFGAYVAGGWQESLLWVAAFFRPSFVVFFSSLPSDRDTTARGRRRRSRQSRDFWRLFLFVPPILAPCPFFFFFGPLSACYTPRRALARIARSVLRGVLRSSSSPPPSFRYLVEVLWSFFPVDVEIPLRSLPLFSAWTNPLRHFFKRALGFRPRIAFGALRGLFEEATHFFRLCA